MGKVIYLIEDKIVDKDDILRLLRDKIPQALQNEISFDWLPGDEQENNGFQFYTNSVLKNIADKKAEVEVDGGKMGILLDLTLTEDETASLGQSFYPEVHLAKEIYIRYKDQIPIYIVTSVNSFGAQCDVIMGEDLSDRYVTKSALLRYKMKNSINDLFNYYKNEFNIEG